METDIVDAIAVTSTTNGPAKPTVASPSVPKKCPIISTKYTKAIDTVEINKKLLIFVLKKK